MAVPFPITSQLTTFDDPPNENPLSQGGKWGQVSFSRAPLLAFGGSATQSVPGDPNYSFWTQEVFNSDSIIEVWACTGGGQLGAALETWRVALWKTLGDSVTGYLAYYGGGIGKGFAIRRYDDGFLGSGGGFTGIAGSGGGYPSDLGLRIDGSQVECWASYDSGITWALQCAATDTAHRGDFYLSIAIEDPTSGVPGSLGFSCFGGGRKNRTQIYRIIRG